MASLKLYETLITKLLRERIDQLPESERLLVEHLDATDSGNVFALYMKTALEHGLRHYKKKEKLSEQLAITNELIARLGELTLDEELDTWLIEEAKLLRASVDVPMKESEMKERIPQTSAARSSLFTGNRHEPQVYRELKREIATADRVDLLVSFIKHSGLRLIYDDLVEHTRTKPLRVITTSYMGATDLKAIEMLAELPNTEIKISYDTKRTRLHAKAYFFERDTGFSTAYIGSSNLSRAALSEGTEWNLKVSAYTSPEIIQKFKNTFDAYWHLREFSTFDGTSAEDVHRLQHAIAGEKAIDFETEMVHFDLKPYSYQEEILDHLEIERTVHGSYRNLVVAATGTGKTMVAAFDFKRFYRMNPDAKLLFIAHRQEILQQSMGTFRGVLRDQNFGELWGGGYLPTDYQYLFATVQTLNSNDQYNQFARDRFDYIVMDETHHVAADSYRRIVDYFKPKILLGLTATPERMDGIDILGDYNDRIAYEIRLSQAIEQNLLCPFHYFGVTDTTDLSNVKWERGRYATNDLSVTYMGDHKRDQAILSAVSKYVTDLNRVRGLGFCVDQAHAAHMANLFNRAGITAEALDANTPRGVRSSVQKRLEKREIHFIFTVDLYNEGVDLPFVDTVLFLRPTDSATVFIQQLGRGLRLHEDKEVLTVLDLIGQAHKQYDYRMKFQKLMGRTSRSLREEFEHDFPSIPRNCFIQLERYAKAYVLKNLESGKIRTSKLRQMVAAYRADVSHPLTVGNFLRFYELDALEFYHFSTLTELKNPNGYSVDERSPLVAVSKLKDLFSKVAMIDDIGWLQFLRAYLQQPRKEVDAREHRQLLMFHYTLFNDAPEMALHKEMKAIKEYSPEIVAELLELIDYNLDLAEHMPKAVVIHPEVPLELHASYSRDQILAALGESTEDKKMPLREGVKYVESLHLDLFLVTLNKSEKHFSESTLYEDYALDDHLFHWQSQSRTTVSSPTGQRYIHQRENGSRVLFFVRENKQDAYRNAGVYTCLGLADYVRHYGSAPISIEYRLRNRMPINVLSQSNQYVDIG